MRTTIPDQSHLKFPDLLKREFTAARPNQRYVGDITYLPLANGQNLYLASVIDCNSRKLVGWKLADHMRTELVTDALKRALNERGSLRGAIFHSDHGSVYTSKDYTELCADLGVIQSMGAIGTSADNALAESFNATIKRELLAGAAYFDNEIDVYRKVFHWANRYNTKRRHSWCGNVPPNEYESTNESHYAKVA